MNVAHSIDYDNTEIYIASGNFMCAEKNNQEYSSDKIHPVDPEMLTLTVLASCLILPQTPSILGPLKICFQDNFKTVTSVGPTSQTYPIGTSLKPELSQHIETGQQMMPAAFF